MDMLEETKHHSSWTSATHQTVFTLTMKEMATKDMMADSF